MKRIIFSTFLSLTLFFFNFGFAKACSCVPPSPPQESLQKSDAVFVGTVTNIDTPNLQKTKQQFGLGSSADPVKVTLSVSRVWKGPENKTIIVKTARSSASCGYNFEKGKEYIVYANRNDNGLSTGLCSRTSLVSKAQEDLGSLGEGNEPKIKRGPEKISFFKHLFRTLVDYLSTLFWFG